MNASSCLISGVPPQTAVPAGTEADASQLPEGDFAALLAEAGTVEQPAEEKTADLAVPVDSMSVLAGLLGAGLVLPAVPQTSAMPVTEEGDAAQAITAASTPLSSSMSATETAMSATLRDTATAEVPPSATAVPEIVADVLKEIAVGNGAEDEVGARILQAASAGVQTQPKTTEKLSGAPSGMASGNIAQAVDSALSDSAVTAGDAGDAAVSRGAQAINALLERTAARVSSADGEIRTVTGVELYANTRETVAGNAGAAVSQPESLRSAVGTPRWANELGSKLVVMSLRGQQEGSLSLTPEHLGPVEVRISINQDTTNLWFGAQHAETRAALTEALPRLRELFAASGLSLGQAGVSQEAPRQENRSADLRSAVSRTEHADVTEVAASAPQVRRIRVGALDAWA